MAPGRKVLRISAAGSRKISLFLIEPQAMAPTRGKAICGEAVDT
jgi:hypothetical protein